MENKNNGQDSFIYNYSAKEQAEVKKIREKYTQTTEAVDKLTKLRRLDASVTQSAQVTALIFGIIGTLILGLGMSLCMTELATFFGLDNKTALLTGIIIGVIGGILASLAYPIYNAIVKAKRKRIAPEIIRLTDELMQ